MEQPTLTDEKKLALAVLAGVQMEFTNDGVVVRMRPKNELGFFWDGQRWIVYELRK